MGQSINAIPTYGSCARRPPSGTRFAFMFDGVYEFEAGETLTLRYQLVIASGGWDAGQIEEVAGVWRGDGRI